MPAYINHMTIRVYLRDLDHRQIATQIEVINTLFESVKKNKMISKELAFKGNSRNLLRDIIITRTSDSM